MTYRIPDDDVLAVAIYAVLHRHSPVRSQGLMAALVNDELWRHDPLYRAGAERIRRLAIVRNLADVLISYNDAERDVLPSECPVCTADLRPIANQTLTGDSTVIGQHCQRCRYSIGMKPRVPGLYIFQKKVMRHCMDEDKLRIKLEKLDQARIKMLEARDLIEDALRMTGMEMWAERGILNALSVWAEGLEEHTSIVNLKKELEYKNNTNPIWTRPLASVKYVNRRDI